MVRVLLILSGILFIVPVAIILHEPSLKVVIFSLGALWLSLLILTVSFGWTVIRDIKAKRAKKVLTAI